MALMTITTSVSEFQNIRDGNKYYVDKSLLIDDLLSKDESGSYLCVRPRRFGKSMNLSMLDAFFNMRYEGNRWFDGLAISEHPELDGYKNSFPVIHMDLRNAKTGSNQTYEDFIEKIGVTGRTVRQSVGAPTTRRTMSSTTSSSEMSVGLSTASGTSSNIALASRSRASGEARIAKS